MILNKGWLYVLRSDVLLPSIFQLLIYLKMRYIQSIIAKLLSLDLKIELFFIIVFEYPILLRRLT